MEILTGGGGGGWKCLITEYVYTKGNNDHNNLERDTFRYSRAGLLGGGEGVGIRFYKTILTDEDHYVL